MSHTFAPAFSPALCIAAPCSVILAACLNTQQPVVLAPAAESPVVPQVVPASAAPLTLAVAPPEGTAQAAPARSEFEPDGLIVPPNRKAITPRVHQVAAPPAARRIWSVKVGRTTFRTTMA